MKSLVNNVNNAVAESLSGLNYAYPQLEFQVQHKVVLAPDIQDRVNRVSLICGGGSGHEPFAAGFVGSGMLSAAVAGSIFASPPPLHIEYAIHRVAAHNKAGILVIIPNYTGDNLNFGIAVQRARQAGLNIADVVVGDDCSIPIEDQSIAGKRGLSGMVFAMKIAGALAEMKLPLQDVVNKTQEVLKNLATYGVGLTACSVPGQGLMFELQEDEIEFGMGIHGEAGYKRDKLSTVQEVVALMLHRICDFLSLVSGDSVAVIINNFGALSQLEQGIVVNETVLQLKNLDIQPLRVYSAVLVTSLNSSGVHITLLKLPKDLRSTFIDALDFPTNAPKWPGCAYSVPRDKKLSLVETETQRKVQKVGIQMEKSEQKLLKKCIVNSCKAITEKEEYLNELDRGCGDADCGTTLQRCANGIMKNLDHFHFSHPASTFLEMANIAEEEMGGSSGALYCLFFTVIANELTTAERKDGWLLIGARAFRSALETLMKYGKAKPGDRSMIDPLDAACRAFENSVTQPIKDVFRETAKAAGEACEATKNMKPKVGRASYVKQEQYLKNVDAGSFGVVTWINAVTNTILNS